MINNAHRLPRKSRSTDGLTSVDQGPDPIIAKFAIMRERDHVLEAYQSRNKNTTEGEDRARHDATATGKTQSRISVRTDLPPSMKYRRGKLASTAYRLRKKKNLSTKIFVKGTDVILQFKGKGDREWKTYTDDNDK